MNHLTWERFSSFADGSAPADERTAIAAHVRECAACAALLSRYSQIDMAIYQAATERMAVVPQRWMLVAASVAVIVSAGLAYRFTRPSGEILDLSEIVCPDGDDQQACIARAQAHGLAVSYPPLGGAPILAEFQPLAGEYR